MKQIFTNKGQLQCIFTEDGVSFNSPVQEAFLPYSCVTTIDMSLFGVLQVTSGPKVFTFAVAGPDRSAVRQLVKAVRKQLGKTPVGEPQITDLTRQNDQARVDSSLAPEEQLKEYKRLFVQGVITKEEFDMKKRQLS